jgi:thymidine phosphorylase
MVAAQGGNPDAPLPVARHAETVVAERDGYLAFLDAMAVGLAAWRLGAGRQRQGEPVQAAAGVRWHARPGDRVTQGQPLLTLCTDTPERLPAALAELAGAYGIEDAAPPPRPLVLGRIG